MERLKEIAQSIEKIKESRWSFTNDIDRFSSYNVDGLSFEGELDKDDLYLVAPVTFLDPTSGDTIKMTNEEIHEYLDTGDVDGKEDWVIDTWLVIRYDLSRDYVRIYKATTIDHTKSPRDNYEIEYARVKEFINYEVPVGQLPQIYELKLSDYHLSEPWRNLKEAIEFTAQNRRYDAGLPIDTRRSRFFHALNRNILDDQFERSNPTETIALTDNYTKVKLTRSTMNILNGVQLDHPYFASEEVFQTKKDLIDYLLSVLNWSIINLNYEFSSMLKVNESNLWGYKTQDGGWSSPDGISVPPPDYTKFVFRCCNVKGAPIVEAECWENGHVYTYKNHEDGTPLFFKREIQE
jgi:hypothetical protein